MSRSNGLQYFETPAFNLIPMQSIVYDTNTGVSYLVYIQSIRSVFLNEDEAYRIGRRNLDLIQNQKLVDEFNKNKKRLIQLYGPMRKLVPSACFITVVQFLTLLKEAEQIDPEVDWSQLSVNMKSFIAYIEKKTIVSKKEPVSDQQNLDRIMPKYLDWIRDQVQQENTYVITAQREQLYKDKILKKVDDYYLRQKQLIMAQIDRDAELQQEVIEELCQRPEIQARAKEIIQKNKHVRPVSQAGKAPWKPPQ